MRRLNIGLFVCFAIVALWIARDGHAQGELGKSADRRLYKLILKPVAGHQFFVSEKLEEKKSEPRGKQKVTYTRTLVLGWYRIRSARGTGGDNVLRYDLGSRRIPDSGLLVARTKAHFDITGWFAWDDPGWRALVAGSHTVSAQNRLLGKGQSLPDRFFMIPLPTKPVAIGAKWTHRYALGPKWTEQYGIMGSPKDLAALGAAHRVWTCALKGPETYRGKRYLRIDYTQRLRVENTKITLHSYVLSAVEGYALFCPERGMFIMKKETNAYTCKYPLRRTVNPVLVTENVKIRRMVAVLTPEYRDTSKKEGRANPDEKPEVP